MKITAEQLLADINTTRELKYRYGSQFGNITGSNNFAKALYQLEQLYSLLHDDRVFPTDERGVAHA